MENTIKLLQQEFIGSCGKTTQYIQFHKTFKKDITKILKPYCSIIKIYKPNHFGGSGFFELKNKNIYYFSLRDLSAGKKDMLIRTAKDFNDFTGGTNNFICFNNKFKHNLLNYIGVV